MTLLEALKIDNPTLTNDTSFYFVDNEEKNVIYFCYYECFKRMFTVTRLNSEKDFTTYAIPLTHLRPVGEFQLYPFFDNITLVNVSIKVLDN